MTEFEKKYNEISAEIERIKAEVKAASEAVDTNNLQMHQQMHQQAVDMHQQAAAEFNAQQLRDIEQQNIQNIINSMMF